jgi:hypothetical protein
MVLVNAILSFRDLKVELSGDLKSDVIKEQIANQFWLICISCNFKIPQKKPVLSFRLFNVKP